MVDAFNQLITIASYLNGSMVFISTDGFLRDASEIHGKLFRKDLLQKSLDLVFRCLKSLEFDSVEFVVDEQLMKRQMIVDSIGGIADSSELIYSAVLTDKADSFLIGCTSGLIATSDSQIIDKSNLNVFDLARFVLYHFYNPDFFEIKPLLPREK